jgi:hypothetical protein
VRPQQTTEIIALSYVGFVLAKPVVLQYLPHAQISSVDRRFFGRRIVRLVGSFTSSEARIRGETRKGAAPPFPERPALCHALA